MLKGLCYLKPNFMQIQCFSEGESLLNKLAVSRRSVKAWERALEKENWRIKPFLWDWEAEKEWVRS